MKAYQITEHTADIGLRIWGRGLKDLLIHGAEGVFNLITDLERIKKFYKGKKNSNLKSVPLKLKAENEAELFLLWLREWVFLFSTKRVVPFQFHFQKVTSEQLEASTDCVIFDPRTHEQRYEVKAVTYHNFKIQHTVKGWTAEVIVDV